MTLSICIPTYNRLRFLKELVPSILCQLEGMQVGDVELVVSDNASTDGTADYLRSIDDTHLRWWTNEENIGGDRNFLKCVVEAKGEYVWLFGDDDLIPDDSVARVLNFLRRNNPSLLISVDYDVEPRLYGDYCELLADFGDNLVLTHTLISANIFKRELFDMDLAVEKLWVQYAHMFGVMSRMAGHAIGVMPRFVETRPVRAEFAKYPSCLCVKQAIYMWFLAKRFDLPRFRRRAIWNACNLPVEYAARVWNFMKRDTSVKIVIRVSDELGNQMFEYALGKYLSEILGCEMVFDRSHFLVLKNRTFLLDKFSGPTKIRRWGVLKELPFLLLWALKSKMGERCFKSIISCLGMRWIPVTNPFALQSDFDVDSVKSWHGTVYISGCYGHVPHMPDREALRRLFTLVGSPSGANQRYLDDMRSSESVSVHIRRTDYLLACNNAPALDVQYQRKAMDVVRGKVVNPKWFIFSDDIEWCRNEFADLDGAVFVSGNEDSPWEDIRLMSACKHHIVANSSFSWWGAYLGNSDGFVLYPSPWFNGLEMPASGVAVDWIPVPSRRI